jgi:hypothetical protein
VIAGVFVRRPPGDRQKEFILAGRQIVQVRLRGDFVGTDEGGGIGPPDLVPALLPVGRNRARGSENAPAQPRGAPFAIAARAILRESSRERIIKDDRASRRAIRPGGPIDIPLGPI